MKIILLQDVKSLGKKGDMVNVSDGYARNMILPKKLGVEANAKNLNDLKLQKAHEEKVAKENLEAAQAFAKDLEEKQQLGYDIDKKKMQLPSPIRELGTTIVPVRLHTKVTANLKVVVREA